jgi:hypothetical protein
MNNNNNNTTTHAVPQARDSPEQQHITHSPASSEHDSCTVAADAAAAAAAAVVLVWGMLYLDRLALSRTTLKQQQVLPSARSNNVRELRRCCTASASASVGPETKSIKDTQH